MGPIRLLAAPIRSIVSFPLFQLAVVVAIILFLQAANDNTAFGQMTDGCMRAIPKNPKGGGYMLDRRTLIAAIDALHRALFWRT
jgi:hypothetical protein